MDRIWKMVLVTTIALLPLLGCSQPEPEAPPPDAAPAVVETGPDPTVVDGDHYKTEFENDQVRVLRITYGPGEESVMHYHPDNVAVFLTDAHTEFGMPDGSSEGRSTRAGEHSFAPAGLHLPKNIGDEPVELVLIELKDSKVFR